MPTTGIKKQCFSIPYPIMRYLARNPSTSSLRWKLLKTCKRFLEENVPMDSVVMGQTTMFLADFQKYLKIEDIKCIFFIYDHLYILGYNVSWRRLNNYLDVGQLKSLHLESVSTKLHTFWLLCSSKKIEVLSLCGVYIFKIEKTKTIPAKVEDVFLHCFSSVKTMNLSYGVIPENSGINEMEYNMLMEEQFSIKELMPLFSKFKGLQTVSFYAPPTFLNLRKMIKYHEENMCVKTYIRIFDRAFNDFETKRNVMEFMDWLAFRASVPVLFIMNYPEASNCDVYKSYKRKLDSEVLVAESKYLSN